MGKNVSRLLRFALNHPGWNSYGTDRSTRDALNTLVDYQLIELNESRQFRIKIDYVRYRVLFQDECFKKANVYPNT